MDERCLEDIAGHVTIADHAKGQGKQTIADQLGQLREGLSIASLCLFDEPSIHGAPHHAVMPFGTSLSQ